MHSPKLTTRQIETLRHIHDFISRHGISPSILELRNAMGGASDQGVIEILQRLEDRGMVEKRPPGQARGLKLTSAAHLVIGVATAQTAPSSGRNRDRAARRRSLGPSIGVRGIALDAGGESLRGVLSAVGAAFTCGADVRIAQLYKNRFGRPINIKKKQIFTHLE